MLKVFNFKITDTELTIKIMFYVQLYEHTLKFSQLINLGKIQMPWIYSKREKSGNTKIREVTKMINNLPSPQKDSCQMIALELFYT